ncbi:DASS family sodium-coupled anion symporter [Cryobacterium luteum]|uniref:DASS family sodium-coupled anion symporter n=1 Tax=Cryobacterium luteum TaxID=1424661 RepID=A0A1H8JAQ4_9MICO|nr:DASS family sodium-coupled anion symporter [Cryobacterium luteum]TFB92350.1 DASS family sodium-coupled anion symporter [Cryobacterium luteum]SEN77983.1 divalent anion:Na+ symporter, DASS family [Cryobacterium luteum]
MSTESTVTSVATEAPGRRTVIVKVAAILLVTLAIYLVPPPDGVDARGMHMLAIFVGTILGLILQPLPTPSVALLGLALAMITGTMDPATEALKGFSNPTIWLIVAAFFIAEGFLLTGLGRRIALWFISKLGASSLGLSYGLALTDLVLAPATPSNTARNGGVLYPIIASLSREQGSTPDTDASRRKLGSYLAFTSVQVNAVTSAMFITAMAGNPIAQQAAIDLGIDVTWGNWALAALVPGLLSLVAVPWVMSKVYGPTITKTPEAPAYARKELAEMGRMSRGELVMTGTFVLLLVLWVLGSMLGISATAAAFVGIGILLVTRVLTWKDMAENVSAWSTLIFFSVLVGMADQLNALGVIGWIGDAVAVAVGGLPWMLAFAILTLAYFYAHYFFASNTAQIVAMYAIFLGAAIASGAPPMFAALTLGFIGNLFGAITHYASGPAGVIYGSGYVKTSEWFRVGFIMSVVLIAIWTVSASLWMKVLGLW